MQQAIALVDAISSPVIFITHRQIQTVSGFIEKVIQTMKDFIFTFSMGFIGAIAMMGYIFLIG